ncbi:MAG: hypothetical protein NTW10_10470 [Bacteroidetes bacterium]|nr:hypothetical protein [Bacteroidota bacterium]
MHRILFTAILIFYSLYPDLVQGQDVKTLESSVSKTKTFHLQNENITCKVVIQDNRLEGDSLIGNSVWLSSNGSSPFILCTDAGFGLQFTWTDWQAPKKLVNADNPVIFDKTDLEMTGHRFRKLGNGGAEVEIAFRGTNNPLLVKVTYHLDPGTFFFKRKIAVSDTTFGYHFLEKIFGLQCRISGYGQSGIRTASKIFEERSTTGKPLQPASGGSFFQDPVSILKSGDFGQPAAFTFQQTGAFFGLEYPASENSAKSENTYQAMVECSQEFGRKIGKEEVETDWTVEALVPSLNVKDWFYRYVDEIRVAPAKPYTLYNSWYASVRLNIPKYRPTM